LPGGAVSAWGNNADGQLGDGSDPGSEPYSFDPVTVALDGSSATALAGGANDGYALTSNGNVLAWGNNSHAELGVGDGPGGVSSTAAAVSDLSNATAIAAGSRDGYALTSVGTVVAWGSNSGDALGDGSDSDVEPNSDAPHTVVGLSNATGIAAGNLCAYATQSS
jgi:alpha-tubulin suppressor-like RCC1 family protein